MPDSLIQKEFAGYRIESRIGRGGMGVVYRATDLALDRVVALKVLSEDLALDEGFRRRFVTESKLAASLDHPNVIPIHAAGEHDGVLYIAMRFVPGDDLRTRLAEDGRVIVVESEGETRVERLLWGVMLGDLVSLQLAARNQVDPAPIEVIDRLKEELGRS